MNHTIPPPAALLAALLCNTALHAADAVTDAPRTAVLKEWDRHYDEMRVIITNGGYLYKPQFMQKVNTVDPGLAARGIGNADSSRALDPEAFYHKNDKDPFDIVFRRTRALLDYLRSKPVWKGCSSDPQARLASIGRQAGMAADPADRKELYRQVCAIRRELAFSNPLLRFDSLLIASRTDVRNCVWMSWAAGKGVWIVRDPFGKNPQIENLFQGKTVQSGRYAGKPVCEGSFSSLELSFDAKKILFSWCPGPPSQWVRWDRDKVWHIFQADRDGSNCIQLTDGPFADMDPCYLPSGRIAFTSYRRSPDKVGMYIRCIADAPNVYTLHSCAADGSDIVTMSYHDLPEYNPSIDHDGKLVYTRWDYYDKASHWTGNLWVAYPDGRDPRAPHGNYYLPHQTFVRTLPNGKGSGLGNPQMEQGIRALPGYPGLYTAAAAAVHGGEMGSLILINTTIEDDYGMAQVSRLTPEVVFPESEFGDMGYGLGKAVYGYCWPLDRDFYLCSYGGNICVLDRFGNRELICAADEVPGALGGLVDPTPLRPRPRPPEIPVATYEGARNALPHRPATIQIMNVYDSDLPWPSDVVAKKKIQWIRVLQFFPKNEDELAPVHGYRHGALGYAANADYGNTNNCRMPLGVVPVEDDGSAYFYAPIRKDIFFQALDENGMAIQSMRSATYVQAGEHISCQGCHENKWKAARIDQRPKALSRAPSILTAEVSDGAVPFNFHRLANPVFEKTCVPCHLKETGKAGTRGPGTMTYESLRPYAFCFTAPRSIGGVACEGSRTIPGHFGAGASRMGQTLLNPTHQEAKKAGLITEEDFRRVVLWLDCNSAQYGTIYSKKQVAAQQRGEIVFPRVDFQPWNPLGLEIYHTDGTPPTAVSGLRAIPTAIYPLRIDLSWNPAVDGESGVGCYAIYRDGTFYTWALQPSCQDIHVLQGERYTYEVAAVNRNGKEGPKSASAAGTCRWDPASPHDIEWDPDTMTVSASSCHTAKTVPIHTVHGNSLSKDKQGHASNNESGNWLSRKGDVSTAWIQYDLGRVYPIAGMSIWNYNQRGAANCGIKEAEILVSTDGASWTSCAKPVLFPEANGPAGDTGLEHRFVSVVTAKHVKLNVKSNYGGDAVGLSKVRFYYGLKP
jgi:hypothetical protein